MKNHVYTPEGLRLMASHHEHFTWSTNPARDHFAEVCRQLADRIEKDNTSQKESRA